MTNICVYLLNILFFNNFIKYLIYRYAIHNKYVHKQYSIIKYVHVLGTLFMYLHIRNEVSVIFTGPEYFKFMKY